MASQTETCNLALIKLGAARITSLDDGTKQSKIMGQLWNTVRDAEMSAHPWSFAATRALIPASATPPAFGWAYAYPQPTDFLKFIEVGEDWMFYTQVCGSPWFTIEGGAVLTDQGSPLKIRYVRRITNVGAWPASFVEAMACRLAAEACESLTQDLSKREAAWAERKEAVRDAKRTNDIQMPPQRAPASEWELAMRGIGG